MEQNPDHKTDQTKGSSGRAQEVNPNLKKEANRPSDEATSDDALEFVVTEKNEDDREFVGGKREFSTDHDDLGIESPRDLMEKEALSAKEKAAGPIPTSAADFEPIGPSESPPPPEPNYSRSLDDSSPETAEAWTLEQNQAGQEEKVKKLSPQEVKEIEKNLYGGSPYLTDQEKEQLIKKIDKLEGPDSNAAISTPKQHSPSKASREAKSGLPPPTMAKRGKGIAYFYKNYIQVMGNQELYPGDDLHINDRCYELNPKQFNRKAIIGGAVSILFAFALFLVGSLFISNAGTGEGEIIGIVLDDAGQPYVQGATIRFPELGKSTNSTPQGFFRSGLVPEGTHKIEYSVDGRLRKVDFATVVGDKITMIALKPSKTEMAAVPSEIQSEPEPPAFTISSEPATHKSSQPTQAQIDKRTPKKSVKSSAPKSKKKNLAKITLAANIEGARFALDEAVLGAGNLTYSKLKPGKHTYTVSKDGYQPASGTIKLSPGENKTLKIDLNPMEESEKEKAFSEEDFYYSGLAALKEGNSETAIADLTQAINQRPSHAEAYTARAEAYLLTREKKLAHDDCVRAAEIFQIKKNLNQAITAYNNAIKIDKKSVTAYLGRANTYLAKGEEIAAIADYEVALKLDKRNAQTYYGLGEARFKQGRYKKAAKHFKDARSLDPKNPLTYQYLMLCYLAMDDIKNVKKSFEKFKNVASDEQMNRLRADRKFSAVLRIVEND